MFQRTVFKEVCAASISNKPYVSNATIILSATYFLLRLVAGRNNRLPRLLVNLPPVPHTTPTIRYHMLYYLLFTVQSQSFEESLNFK